MYGESATALKIPPQFYLYLSDLQFEIQLRAEYIPLGVRQRMQNPTPPTPLSIWIGLILKDVLQAVAKFNIPQRDNLLAFTLRVNALLYVKFTAIVKDHEARRYFEFQ